MTQTKKGFTLIELLVVIAVIMLLSLLAVIALGQAREAVRDSKRLSDIAKIQAALEIYYINNTAYPTVAAPGQTLGVGNFVCLNSAGFAPAGCSAPYLAVAPQDPGKSSYIYSSPDGTSYSIRATLEGESNGLQGTITATPSTIQ